ncbi:hypothetical protein JSO62_06165 [Riemerella anatipestifer]|uniref:WD40/YVTN/BNR-like repeat-containing protein n=1 Tax=Riemerella anatipestifer TaxID=34085 RepID=UPI0030BB9F9E
MKKLLMCFLMILVAMGCEDYVKEKDNIEILIFEGMKGESKYMFFINPKVGYSFNNHTVSDWHRVTEEQLKQPNFFPKSTDISIIYKTIDGGKTWASVYSIDDFRFDKVAFSDKNRVYIKIINSKETLNNKLLKFELETNKATVFSFNFERMGEIWAFNQKVFINSKNNGINTLYSIDNDFTKIDSIEENKIFKDKITLLDNTPYTITWDNELYNIEKKEAIRLCDIELESIIEMGKSNILVACKKEFSIILVEYDTSTKKRKYLKEFSGYDIVKGLQSNDKVICGFIGSIKGMFTEYDLFYSLDKGKTWHIQELKEKSYISSSALVDDILYIFSGGKRMQKILLK